MYVCVCVTPCTRVVPEKVTFPQVISRSLEFYGTRGFISVLKKVRHFPLSRATNNPVDVLRASFFNTHFNSILYYNPAWISLSTHACHITRPSPHPSFDLNTWQDGQLTELPIWQTKRVSCVVQNWSLRHRWDNRKASKGEITALFWDTPFVQAMGVLKQGVAVSQVNSGRSDAIWEQSVLDKACRWSSRGVMN